MSIRWLTAFVDLPAADSDAAVSFWTEATGTVLSAPRGRHQEFATLVPPDGDAYLRVQRVGSEGAGVHLDVHVQDITGFAWRAVCLGAVEVAREEGEIVVLRSPGGFQFCVVGWQGEAARPSAEPGVVDQVCLDISPSAFETEAAFWADLTGREPRRGSRSEFVVLPRQEGLPLRLLLQRLDDDRPGPVTGHLDLAAGGELDKVVDRLVGIGAKPLRETDAWVTLRDPAGLEFCVTRREPESGVLA